MMGWGEKNQGELLLLPASLPSWNLASGNLGMQLFRGKIPPGNEGGSIPELQVPKDGMWIPAWNSGISQGSA